MIDANDFLSFITFIVLSVCACVVLALISGFVMGAFDD